MRIPRAGERVGRSGEIESGLSEIISAANFSYKSLLHSWRWLPIGMFLDIAFFFVFGKLYAVIFTRTSELLGTVNGILSSSLESFASSADVGVLASRQAELDAAFRGIFIWIGILLLALYACWVLFQGSAWWVARRMAGHPANFARHILRQSWLNLVWLGVFVLITTAASLLSFQSGVAVVPLLGQRGVVLVTVLAVLVMGYFAFISYCLERRPLRGAFVVGWSRARTLIPAYIAAFIVFLLVFWLLPMVARAGVWFVLGYLLLVLLPLLSFLRLLFATAVARAKLVA